MLSLPPPPPSSSSSIRYKYDVFLSFRGEDTRKEFTDHLHAALKRRGILTFRDDPKLEAGKQIASELFKAIQESWCSLVVFSETYAFSSWCLDELAEIVHQKNEKEHKVFPIFYHVNPSDLRRQTGKVKEAFAKHEDRYKEDKYKIQRWRNALKEVADIKGWHLLDSHESNFIEDIVRDVSIKLCVRDSHIPDGLVGIDSRLEKLLLKVDIEKEDVRIIGICGMGGIGKTTLATVFYAQMSSYFDGKCFLADVRGVSDNNKLVFLQKQLLSQIFLEESFPFFTVDDGKAMIRRLLSQKKVLVVIDDVDNLQQLQCLVGRRDWFGSRSRIIITGRDQHLLAYHKVDDVYEPATLDDSEALHLFNIKAFHSDTVTQTDDFIELSMRVVKYATGLPFALEVLGSFLYGRDIVQWRSAIKRLERDSNKGILDKLQIGFDGLEETEKNIFLDIACFFNRMDKDFVEKVLHGCDFFPDIGLAVLIEKCLIKDRGKYYWMHDLLQEMGRKFVRQKSLEPGQRCRLWEEKDFHHVLRNDTATGAIEGVAISIKWEKEKTFHLSADAFLKMKRLRLLKVFCPTASLDVLHHSYDMSHPKNFCNVLYPTSRHDLNYSKKSCNVLYPTSRHDLNYPKNFYNVLYPKSGHDLNFLPSDLRLLDWTGYPFKSLSSSFQPDNLVALLIPYSHIERPWKKNCRLPKLKLVDLHDSKNLMETPDFTMAPNLETLNLAGCTRIVDVHPSIGVLRRLKLLNLRGCKRLSILPTEFRMDSLEKFILSGCSNLQKLPSSIGHLRRLKYLDLTDCKNLRRLPTKIGMESLERFILSGCSNLERFPEIDGEMKRLEWLFLDGTGIEELPSSIGNLNRLTYLELTGCKSLRSLPATIIGMESLGKLALSGCSSLESLPEIDGNIKCLVVPYLDGTGIESLPSSSGHLSRLKFLDLTDCKSLRSLPTTIIGMESLKEFILSGCSNLERFPDIDDKMKCLEMLRLDGTGIEELPSSIGLLTRLKELCLRDCKSLRSLPTNIIGMESLNVLILSGCKNLERFPEIDGEMKCLLELYLDGTGIEELPSSIGHLSNLVLLNLKDCSNLVGLPSSLDGCKCLRNLNLSGCSRVETLPENLQQLETLEELDLSETAISRNLPSFIFQFKNLKFLSGCKGSIAPMLPHLSGLSSLMKLDLSYCNLGDDDILGYLCSLSSLKELDLSGNNFKSLPASLGRFPNLYLLNLLDCRNFKSLPESFTCVEQVNVDGCVSLEVVEDPTTVCKKGFEVTIRGTNCFRLAEKNKALSLLKKHLKVHANTRGCFNIFVPGSEIPEWFSHQTDETSIKTIDDRILGRLEQSFISIKVPLPFNDSPWVGVAFCCVFVSDFKEDGGPITGISQDILIPGIYSVARVIFFAEKDKGQQAKKDHLWLRYWTRDELHRFYRLRKPNDEPDWDQIFKCKTHKSRDLQVKKCGVRIVYEKDLEEMEQIEKQLSSPASVNFDDDDGLVGNGGALT